MSGPLLDLRALARALAQLPEEELAPLRERLVPREPIHPASVSPYMTAAEAGAYLRPQDPRRGRRRVYELVADGRLTRHGDGRSLLVNRAEVEALAAGG